MFAFAMPARCESEATDVTIAGLVDENRVAGLGVAIVREGRITYLQTFGAKDAAHRLPLEPDTVMYGASLTKAAFATWVMQLVDAGRVQLDCPIAAYLPQPLPGIRNTQTSPVTKYGYSGEGIELAAIRARTLATSMPRKCSAALFDRLGSHARRRGA